MRRTPLLASRGARTAVTVVALVAACAVALGSGVAVGSAEATEEERPATVARRYVDAIAAGDANTANRLARVPADRAALLTDAALASAERIVVEHVRPEPRPTPASGGRATFAVSYVLGGSRHRGRVEVAKDARGWHVARGLAVTVPALARKDTGVGIAGAAAPLAPGLLAYPARYALTAGKRLFTLSGDAVLTIADGRGTFGHDFTVRPSPAFAAEVQHAVEARLAQCAALTSFEAVVACGIALDEPSRVDPARAEVTVTEREAPRVEVATDDGGGDFLLAGGRFSARVRGPAPEGRVVETVSGYVGDLHPRIAVEGDEVLVDFGGPLADEGDAR
jgi:hypothetical protein